MAKPKAKSLAEKAATPKNLAIAERARNAALGAGEPKITPENYNADIGAALTYYNTYSEEKDRRKWVQKYIGKDKAALAKLTEVSDFDLRQTAILIRLAEREQPLKPEHIEMINSKLVALLGATVAKAAAAEEKPIKTKPSVYDRIERIATEHIGEIEAEVDKFIIEKKNDFSMKEYVTSKAINAPTAKIIGGWFKKRIPELKEALTVSKAKVAEDSEEEQLQESYSYFTKAQLKKFVEFFESIVEGCVQAKVSVVRKVRKVKVKPASEIVKRVKYMLEDPELKIKSEHPTKLVNSSQALIYNSKTRRITRLLSLDNDILVVKGSTIRNFDTSRSESRILRKPADFFGKSFTKSSLAIAWKSLTTKVSNANGRLNSDCIIVAIF